MSWLRAASPLLDDTYSRPFTVVYAFPDSFSLPTALTMPDGPSAPSDIVIVERVPIPIGINNGLPCADTVEHRYSRVINQDYQLV